MTLTRYLTRCAALLLALALLVPTAPAEEAGPAPGPLAALKASNARLQRFVLDNGAICLVKEDHSAPVAAVHVWVGAGAIHEGRYLGAGLSHFIEHMIFKGTPTRGVGEITRQIDDAGGNINAYTAFDRTVFHATLPAANWRTALDVLADAVMNASFPEEEWERERDVILREIAMNRDDPHREIGKLLWRTAYRVHPYRVPVIGYEDVFKSTTRDDLVTFFRGNYMPDNMIVAVVGDLNAAEMEAGLREVFGAPPRRAREPAVLPAEPPQLAARFARQTGPYEVSRLHWAYHAVPLSHPDAPALDVLSTIVGEGRSSRLVRRIKEEQQLVFDIDAWSWTPMDPGLFGISATFDPTNEQAVLEAVGAEVATWSSEPFTDEEIEKARRMVLVAELSQLQTMDGQAYAYASGEYYAADPLFSERYLEQLERVTARDLQDAAARYLTPANRTLVILSPAATNAAPAAGEAEAAETNLQKIVLANGVPLIVREDHRLPFVYFCAALGGGLLSETAADNGITQLMAELLTRGTSTRTAEDIAAAVERLGGSLSAFSGRNSFGLQARCLAQDAETFMELLADALLHPVFPGDELEKRRAIQLAAIRQERESPFFVADEALRQTLFPGHPYQWTMSGTKETVEALTRDDVEAHFRRLVVQGNLVLSIFGDVTPADAARRAERFLSDLPAGEMPSLAHAAPAPELPARIKKREPKQQTIVLIGYPGVDVKDSRMDALSVIENAVSGLSSDLSTEVREKRGLVYFIGGFNRPGLEPGVFALYAGTHEDRADTVEEFMNNEAARIAADGLREEEFERAREQIIASQQMSLQDNGSLAQVCALNELYGLGYAYSFALEGRLRALTPDAVRKAAASVFDPGRRATSLVFPEKQDTEATEEMP